MQTSTDRTSEACFRNEPGPLQERGYYRSLRKWQPAIRRNDSESPKLPSWPGEDETSWRPTPAILLLPGLRPLKDARLPRRGPVESRVLFSVDVRSRGASIGY